MGENIEEIFKQIEDLIYKDTHHTLILLHRLENFNLNDTQLVKKNLFEAKLLAFTGKSKDANPILTKLYQNNRIAPSLIWGDICLNYAQNLIYLGQSKKGIKILEESINIFDNLDNHEKMAAAYILYGNYFYSNVNYESALEYYQKGLEISKSTSSPEYLRAFASMGNIYYTQGQLEKATQYMVKAREMANERENLRMVTLISLNLGMNYHLRGEFDKCLITLNQGLESAKRLQNDLYVCLLQNMKAIYWMDLGDLLRAERILDEIAPFKDDISHPHVKLEYTLARAKLLLLQGKNSQAYRILKEILAFAQKMERKVNTIELMCLFSEVAFSIGNKTEAYQVITHANELIFEDKSEIERARILSSRSKLNLLQHNLDEAKIQILEALWIAQKTHAFELEYQSMLLLVKILLELHTKLAPSNTKLDHQILSRIEESLSIATKYGLIPGKIQSLTLLGLFHILQNNYKRAHLTWKKALKLAKKIKMINYETKLNEFLTIMPKDISEVSLNKTNQISFFGNSSSVQLYANSLFHDQISKVTQTLMQNMIENRDLEDIFIVCYKLEDKIGPNVFLCTNSCLEDSEWKKNLQNIASIYYLTMGQGSSYHQGLFGPFPFFNLDYRAMIYATIVKDPTLKDERMKEKNYYLFVIYYPKRLKPLFYNHHQITGEFEKFIKNLSGTSALNQKILKNFQKNLITSLIPES